MIDMFDLYFDLSKISNPTKEELKRAYDRLPDNEKVFSQYKHGKCVGDYHNNPEQRNAYMREYKKKYYTEMETSEQRERRRERQKLSDAKRHKETYHLRKDTYNAKRREFYRMKQENISC